MPKDDHLLKDSVVSTVFAERRKRLEYLESLNIPEDHMCAKCVKWYKENMGMMPVTCQGGLDLKTKKDIKDLKLKGDEARLYTIVNNPVVWAKELLNWEARWYQEELLLCTATRNAVRAGRRIGKTLAFAIKVLYTWHTKPGSKILVIAPFQDQVNNIFQEIRVLMSRCPELENMAIRNTRSPQRIAQSEDHFILGITAGSRSGMKGDKARGQDATHMYWDEADYLDEGTMDSLLGILPSRPNLNLWTTTTPTGARSFFYKFCTDKQQGFKEFHYHGSVSPTWVPETEYLMMQTMGKNSYDHEVAAEFGDSEVGVYQQVHIDASLEDYDPNSCVRNWNPGYLYTLGVDWNEAKNGVRLVGIEYNPDTYKIKVCSIHAIHEEEFTQLRATEFIRDLQIAWKFDAIYVDWGGGDTQIQILQRMGKADPKTRLAQVVKGIPMGGRTIMYDPISQKEEKFQTKQLMIDLSARRIEVHQCILPKSEDTKGGLVWQMRNFVADSISLDGIPKYSTKEDHTLVAWQLAVFGLLYEFSPIAKRSCTNATAFVDLYKHHTVAGSTNKIMNINPTVVPRLSDDKKSSKSLNFVHSGLYRSPVSESSRPSFGGSRRVERTTF